MLQRMKMNRGTTMLLLIIVIFCFMSLLNKIPLDNSSCISSCLLHLENAAYPQETDSIQSLCGSSANRRGNHQKVVSFSFYGEMNNTDRDYFQGISENIELMQDFYPGWVYRLYFDSAKIEQTTRQTLCSLSCVAEGLDLCLVNSLHGFGNLSSVYGRTWRFLPLSDPTVDIMVSRDLDSRLAAREQAAVSEWLQSEQSFHIMRDHQAEGQEILAGMWGARLDTGAREKYGQALKNLLEDAADLPWDRFLDQDLLARWIWPLVQNEAMVHDSFHCERYKSEHWRPWPTQRLPGPRNFVGAFPPTADNPTDEITWDCPAECRPPDHQEWTMC